LFSQEQKDNAKRAVQHRRIKLKQMAVEYKGGKCEWCSYDKCIDALEFDHIDPTQKEFGISQNGNIRSWDKIKQELNKCRLLCANCHRERHYRAPIFTTTTCAYCLQDFDLTIQDLARRQANNKNVHCSRSCAVKHQMKIQSGLV